MASGKPILSNVGMGYSLINQYHLGIDRKFAHPQEYAAALDTILKLNKEEYDQMCARARNASLEYDLRKLALSYATHILK